MFCLPKIIKFCKFFLRTEKVFHSLICFVSIFAKFLTISKYM